MDRENWLVGAHAVRPAGEPNECFYCKQSLGNPHKRSCPIVSKTALVELKLHLVVVVPESWDAHDVEFHYNESSSCQTNILKLLDEKSNRLDQDNRCMCGLIETSFVRWADDNDEQVHATYIKDSPS